MSAFLFRQQTSAGYLLSAALRQKLPLAGSKSNFRFIPLNSKRTSRHV